MNQKNSIIRLANIRAAQIARAMRLMPLVLITPMLAGAGHPPLSDPCCTVIGVDAARGLVTVRNTETARTLQFKTDIRDIQTIKVGDALEADFAGSVVLSINGAARSYKLSEPDFGEPCCNIINIQTAAPCCAVVTARSKLPGKTIRFSVERESVVKTLKVGNEVSTDSAGVWAFIHSSAGINATASVKAANYSYKVK